MKLVNCVKVYGVENSRIRWILIESGLMNRDWTPKQQKKKGKEPKRGRSPLSFLVGNTKRGDSTFVPLLHRREQTTKIERERERERERGESREWEGRHESRSAGSQRRHWHAWTESHKRWGAKLGFENPSPPPLHPLNQRKRAKERVRVGMIRTVAAACADGCEFAAQASTTTSSQWVNPIEFGDLFA